MEVVDNFYSWGGPKKVLKMVGLLRKAGVRLKLSTAGALALLSLAKKYLIFKL